MEYIILTHGEILCDICNAHYPPDNLTSGGFIFESKAICPLCAPTLMKSIIRYKELIYIKAICPDEKSFYNFVVEYNAGLPVPEDFLFLDDFDDPLP